jgi:hypothetical protein
MPRHIPLITPCGYAGCHATSPPPPPQKCNATSPPGKTYVHTINQHNMNMTSHTSALQRLVMRNYVTVKQRGPTRSSPSLKAWLDCSHNFGFEQ